MYKLFFAAACALAFTGCAEMPAQGQQTQQAATESEPVTGSLFVRKKPKAAPAPAQAESSGAAAPAAQ